MYWFIAILLLISALLIYMSRETRQLVTERVDCAPGAPDKSVLKAVQLSDIHVNMNNIKPERIRTILEAEKPDAIFLTGDYINNELDIKKFQSYLDGSGVAEMAAKRKNVFLCMGNHDVKALKNVKCGMKQFTSVLSREGIEVLRNTTALIKHNNKFVSVTGLKDISEGTADYGFLPVQDYSLKIGLSHNPDNTLDVPAGAFDYMLCGHFHGGQIWAPFSLEYRLLRHERTAKAGIRRGIQFVNGINVYISRGLGNVLVPLRLFSKPEITVFRFPLR